MLAQDAVVAAEAGVDGILLSNHGGELASSIQNFCLERFRSSARLVNVIISTRGFGTDRYSTLPPLEVLYKLRIHRPDVFDKLEGPS